MNVQTLIKTLVVFIIIQLSGGCVDLDSVKQNGKRMIANVFKMVDSVSLYTCVFHCLTVSKCKSVSYKTETRTCHLASQDSVGDPADVHTDPEFFLTDISQWPTSLAGPCVGTTCPSGSRCVVDRLRNPSCMTDEQAGCGPAPDLAIATKSSTGQYEGAVTQYTCLSNFIFCGSSSTHTCSSLGNWEGVSGSCNRSVWYNPSIPFEEPTPCLMTEGYEVRYEGNPTIHGRSVMVVQTTNLILQADIRLTYFELHERFLFNKKTDGVWETDIDIPSPFAPGVEFMAEIARQNGKYEIYINGTYHGYSEDVTPSRHPDTITVEGDIQMDRISFIPV